MTEAPTSPRGVVLARSSFWIACDAVTGVVGAFIASIAVARVMGPEKMGHYSYIMWIANTARIIGCTGLSVGVRRYAAEFLGRGDPGAARAVVQQSFRWQAMVAGALVVASLGATAVLVDPEHRAYTILALLSLVPGLLLGVSAGAVEATQNFAANVKSSIAGTLTNLAATLLVLVQGWGLTGLAASLLLSRLVDSGLRYVAYRRIYSGMVEPGEPARKELDELTRGRLLTFTWQLTLLAAVNSVLWDRSELLFLEQWHEVHQLAFYSLSFGITQQILMLPQVFASATSANLLVEQGRDPSSLGRVAAVVVRYVALLALPMTLGAAALSPSIVHLLYGAAYAPAAPVFAVLAAGAALVAFLASAQNLLIATEKQGLLLRWTLAVAALKVLLDLLIVPKGGAVGAAFANALSQSVAVIGMWIYITRRLAFPAPLNALFRTALAAAASATLAALCGFLLPPLPAVLVGVGAAAIAYVALVRWGRILEPVDADRLLSLKRLLPARAQLLYSGIVRGLVS
jgi:O-antigen/teichoic acid export membrane protein